MSEILSKVEAFVALRDDFVKDLKEMCTDQSIPLQERWDAFIKSDLGHDGFLGAIDTGVIDVNLILEDERRGRTIYYDDWISTHETNIKWGEEPLFNDLDAFKEECLMWFQKGFVNDW